MSEDHGRRTEPEQLLADVYRRIGALDRTQVLASVYNSIGPMDKKLWGWAIRPIVRSSRSRFNTDLPRRGLQGAVANLMSGLWVLTMMLLALAIPAQLLPNPVAQAVTMMVVVLAAFGFARSLVWVWRMYKRTKQWQRSQDIPPSIS